MAFKKLPIEIKPMITSECWTFYKMAIIQTCSYFDTWLASHLKIFTDEKGETFYGENGKIYPLSYYSDVLEIKEERILDRSPNEIIGYIINELDNGNYIIIDLVFGHELQETKIHEMLIHGYDTSTNEFMVPFLINNTFRETRVSFEEVRLAYESARNYYLSHEYKIYTRRKFFFGITVVKPRETYINDNAAYEFIWKLRSEYEGAVHSEECILCINEEDRWHTYNTGLSCLPLLTSRIYKCLDQQDETVVNNNKITCLKICENMHIILKSLMWFADMYAKESSELAMLIKEYEKCYNHICNCVLLFYKYFLSPDTNILLCIASTLEMVYELEKDIMKKLLEKVTYAYIDFLKKDEYGKGA